MGWKSTMTVTRAYAIGLLMSEMIKIPLMTNDQLSDLMDLNFGDNMDKPHYGHNFLVEDEEMQ